MGIRGSWGRNCVSHELEGQQYVIYSKVSTGWLLGAPGFVCSTQIIYMYHLLLNTHAAKFPLLKKVSGDPRKIGLGES